ncbi:hypothetical protein LX32DRAFT_688168 [Colletotrichum zoysiae]|uniref:Secreted protein n=1 Tax=Colletotrichum zoysiae TaxID=1216348 RepID=A0AAD9LT17_9PEZI|nr:hypothetical protein LX32DRAFT_688168 [Colletotrichum zoysiae]
MERSHGLIIVLFAFVSPLVTVWGRVEVLESAALAYYARYYLGATRIRVLGSRREVVFAMKSVVVFSSGRSGRAGQGRTGQDRTGVEDWLATYLAILGAIQASIVW